MIYLYDIADVEVDYEKYHKSEQEVINPKLEELGFSNIGNWWSSEKDSFGPLSRAVKAEKDGEIVTVWYG